MFRNNEQFRYKERMRQRMYVDKIFERATIRGIADYLLFGLEPDEDDRSYEERLDEPYMKFEKAVEKYDKSKTSELLDLCNEVSSETASVYMAFVFFVFPVIRSEEISAIRCSCLFCGSFRLFRWL